MSKSFYDPLSQELLEDCPSLAELDWDAFSPFEDGASLVYGWAASEIIERNIEVAIVELAMHLNRVFEVGDDAQTTVATVGALESWAMTKRGVRVARKLLSGEALRMFELQTTWIECG